MHAYLGHQWAGCHVPQVTRVWLGTKGRIKELNMTNRSKESMVCLAYNSCLHRLADSLVNSMMVSIEHIRFHKHWITMCCDDTTCCNGCNVFWHWRDALHSKQPYVMCPPWFSDQHLVLPFHFYVPSLRKRSMALLGNSTRIFSATAWKGFTLTCWAPSSNKLSTFPC